MKDVYEEVTEDEILIPAWVKKKVGGSQLKDKTQISKIFLYAEDDNKW